MTTRHHWTAQDIAALRQRYPNELTAALAADLGCPIGSVYRAAQRLGLRKSADFFASGQGGRIAPGTNFGASGRFVTGIAPWNKGKEHPAARTNPRVRATQFKPGREASQARNYRPIGSHRVNKDGILERKMIDDPSVFPARRWTPVARVVWEAAHGPIPPKHIVVFKPGMKTAELDLITVERLECITRAENQRRNSAWSRYPIEMACLIQIKGTITRQVNRIIKESTERLTP
jgi:hypothetical protein